MINTTKEVKKEKNLAKAAVDGRKLRTVRGPKGESTRVPWSGGLSAEELARPGGTLLAMLISRANELGHQLGDMAEELNVTYGYISQLRSGLRKTEHISDAFANAAALYLGVPRMTVLLASGRVRPEDVFQDPNEAILALPRAVKFIQNDPTYGPLMPTELLTADEKLQFFVVSLYEAAAGRRLLPGRQNPEKIAEQIKQVHAYRAELTAIVDKDRERKAAASAAGSSEE